jgi:hypothetical protein
VRAHYLWRDPIIDAPDAPAMNNRDQLRLQALDEEDLAVLSAHVQDAVMKVGDLAWLPKERRFALAMNRFVWETADGSRQERRRAALSFDRVTAVKACDIDRTKPGTVLNLLAVRFDPTDAPGGDVTLVFAGGAAIRLTVECIEARLADLGAAWAARAMPVHDIEQA